jgi:hypothetical protein
LVNPENQDLLLEIEDVARSTGQSLEVAKARSPDDLEPAFMQRQGFLRPRGRLIQRTVCSSAGFPVSANLASEGMLNKIDGFCAERDRLKKEQPSPFKGKTLGGRRW